MPDEPTGVEDPTLEMENGAPGAPPPDVFERLRKQYEEATEDRRTTIPIVPGRFAGNLAARYKPVDYAKIRKRIRRAARGGMTEEDELNYGAAVIADACETILVRLADGGPLVPMHEANSQWRSGGPVRYDARLCEAVGIEYNPGLNAASICRLVFKNPAALNDHWAELNAWLNETAPSEEDEEDEGARPT